MKWSDPANGWRSNQATGQLESTKRQCLMKYVLAMSLHGVGGRMVADQMTFGQMVDILDRRLRDRF